MVAPALTVSRVDPRAVPDWDAQVAQFPAASFFHTRAWLDVLCDTYALQPSYFCATRGHDRLAGILPLVEVNSWLTGRRGVALPFTDECAPLAHDASVLRPLVDSVAAHARARRWKYWELRGGTAGLGAPASIGFYAHHLPLIADAARLLARCDSASRRAIRKAEQSGLTITFAHDLEATRQFHSLLCKTRRRLGVPPQPFHFFAQVQRHILGPRRGCIVLAHHQGIAVAGAIFLHFGRSALFKFGASDERFQHLRPNNLVMWRAIDWHARAGFDLLDFGRTSLGNEGLRRFKLGWGTTERRLDYVRFDCRTAAFVQAHDRSSGWHSGLFKLLPVACARLLGAAAYRHVA